MIEVLSGKPWINSVIKENVRPAVHDSEGNDLAPEEEFFGIAEGNLIAVESQDITCNDEIDWCIIVERKDSHMYDTGWTDDNGRPILEPLQNKKFNLAPP